MININAQEKCSTKKRRDPLKGIKTFKKSSYPKVQVPVIFHVVYNKDYQNVSEELIHHTLKNLNEYFLMKNIDV
ncbi:hypothetical protein [Tenacibaculum larymnensis]|uniref:hypothetical protein n=1 Tax=Tenacibaculum larymnensis TaxID=2878201 RepID=UPI00237AD270|nr:hypothetical protein [Tenacibaculum larymnensis]